MTTEKWRKYQIEIVRKSKTKETHELTSPGAVNKLMRSVAEWRSTESLYALTLDGRNQLLGVDEVYKGTATGTSVRISEILRYACVAGGVGVIVVHNHPSGQTEPSDADLQLTKELVAAGEIMDIAILDHIVIGDDFASIRSMRPSLWNTGEEENSEENMGKKLLAALEAHSARVMEAE